MTIEDVIRKSIIFASMRIGYNFYVYIVECSDGSYYTGVTNDLQIRIEQHNRGENPKAFTFDKRPVVLKYFAYYEDINQAIAWEKQVKGWSRAKKEALIDGNWREIIRLSNLKNELKKLAEK